MLTKALKNNFQIDNYKLINYLSLDNNDFLSILSMRNHPLIKKQMNNSIIISLDEHTKFVHNLKFKNVGYWIVKKNNKIFGSIYLTNTNLKESSCVGGNFINPNLIGTGKGIVINYLMHFLAFEKLAFKCINSEVKESNKSAVRINNLFGAQPINSNNNINYIRFFDSTWLKEIKPKICKLLSYLNY